MSAVWSDSIVRAPAAIGIAGICLLAGLWIGRALAPERVVEVVHEKTAKTAATVDTTKTASTTASASADSEARVVTRWKRVVVEGKCEESGERIETKREERKETSASDVRLADRRALTVEVREVEKTRIVESPRRFAVGVAGGLDLHGDPHWGAYARYRVAGPLEVGATVDVPARAGMLTAGVAF